METELRLEDFLPYRLNRALAAASRQFSRIYRDEFGLTVPEWRALAPLGEIGTATAKEIGRDSAMHKTKVSRAVASLQQRRWITRETDAWDRRLEHLTLTAAGRQAHRRLTPKMLAYEAALLDRLTSAERHALLTGLAALERALGIEKAAKAEEVT